MPSADSSSASQVPYLLGLRPQGPPIPKETPIRTLPAVQTPGEPSYTRMLGLREVAAEHSTAGTFERASPLPLPLPGAGDPECVLSGHGSG